MSTPRPFGDGLCAAVRHYLHQNNKTHLGQINAEILADIAERFYAHYHEQIRLKKKRFSDKEWLDELQKEPVYLALDVGQQHGLAQAWCKGHQRICTRRFFSETWLPRALADKPIHYAEPKGHDYKKATAYEPGDFDWPQWVAKKYPRENYPDRVAWEEGKYLEVPFSIRNEIALSQ